jgi:hypothetical protein
MELADEFCQLAFGPLLGARKSGETDPKLKIWFYARIKSASPGRTSEFEESASGFDEEPIEIDSDSGGRANESCLHRYLSNNRIRKSISR